MLTARLDGLDRWLIGQWTEAREFEKSMEKVRTNYETLFQRVIEQVQDEVPALDRPKVFLSSYGQVAFSQTNWPSASSYPSGFWLGGIGLNNLAAQEGDSPYASIWIDPPKSAKIDLEVAKAKILKARAGRPKKLKIRWETSKGAKDCGWYSLPESPKALLTMLLDSNGDRFVECLTAHVIYLARLAPVLDQVFGVE